MAYNVTSPHNNTIYYLHTTIATLKGNRKQRIYYFSKTIKDGAIDALPDGFEVTFNARTGMALLKKIRVKFDPMYHRKHITKEEALSLIPDGTEKQSFYVQGEYEVK